MNFIGTALRSADPLLQKYDGAGYGNAATGHSRDFIEFSFLLQAFSKLSHQRQT
ncbi:hypothetical protein [Jeongeupia sp. USM3]|uniref:hypothetical protein n=1 Tax=Jeongeupia sp. USM3 TaxID=1906741 RepID=UPI001438C01A|nr:hypothetical protein [Jeongeupia sp. USM3]